MVYVPDTLLSTLYVFNLILQFILAAQQLQIKYYHSFHFTDEDTEATCPRSHSHFTFQLQSPYSQPPFFLPRGGSDTAALLHHHSNQGENKYERCRSGFLEIMETLENENKIFFIHQKPTLCHKDHFQDVFSQPPLLSQIKKKKKFRVIVEAIQVGNWVIFVKSSFFANTIF